MTEQQGETPAETPESGGNEDTEAQELLAEAVAGSESEPEDSGGKGGKKAVLADLAKARQENKDLKIKVQEFEDAQKTELERATSAQQSAEKRASDLLQRSLRSEVRALADDFADREDAVLHLASRDGGLERYADDEGGIDTEAIKADLTGVLERKAHLKRDQGPRTPKPDPSQGARPGGEPGIDDQIKDAQSQGNWRKVLSLQNQKLVDKANE